MPRDLVERVLIINLLWYPICMSKMVAFLVLKLMKFVFSQFSENKLLLNHIK